MSRSVPPDRHDVWLTIETVRGVADRLVADGLADPSAQDVATALGVDADVVLAVLAATSRTRAHARAARRARPRRTATGENAPRP